MSLGSMEDAALVPKHSTCIYISISYCYPSMQNTVVTKHDGMHLHEAL